MLLLHKSITLLFAVVYVIECIDGIDMYDEGSGGFPPDDDLTNFEHLLLGLNNTDLLIMVDVSVAAEEFLERLKNISTESIACMKKFRDNNNSVAVMTFASSPSLAINFTDCVGADTTETEKCLLERGQKVRKADGKRNLKKALRKARQLLGSRRSGNRARNQAILLITFGLDEIKTNSPNGTRNKYISDILSKKIANDNITVAVVGVGQESIKNKLFFQNFLQYHDHEYLLLFNDGFILEVLQYSVQFSCSSTMDLLGGYGK